MEPNVEGWIRNYEREHPWRDLFSTIAAIIGAALLFASPYVLIAWMVVSFIYMVFN